MIKFKKSSHNPNPIERKFYQSWIAMRFRCSNKSKGNTRKQYFERGIIVSDRWQHFDYFFIDMWDSYSFHRHVFGKDTELDRIDNNKGYYKGNCRWVTHAENANNRSSQKLFKGKTLTEWSKELKIKRSTLAQRFYVYGWSVDRTLSIKH